MTMYQAIVYLSSSGFSRKQISDIIHGIINDTLYVQNKEAIHYANCQLIDYYNYKEREEQANESNK